MGHIGIDARLPAYHSGGIASYVRDLAGALQELDCAHRIIIFHSRRARGRLAPRLPRATLWTPCHHRLESLGLGAELLRHRLDLLHSPDFIPPRFGARRHVITVCDLAFLKYPQFLTRASRRHYNGQIRRAVRQATQILVISQATRRDLIELLGVPADRITVHYPGVAREFAPLPAERRERMRRELALPEQFLLFVGTFEPRKNVAGLLDAWQILRAELPDAPPLLLAGRRGWLFGETRARIVSLPASARVLLREDLPQAHMPPLYSLATALVMPSFYEGFGLPALESMACGTPPIVSNVSSLPEVVGEVGAQVDPTDPSALAAAMQRALCDSAWLSAQRAAGLQRAAEFTPERAARSALKVYERAL